MNVEVLGDDVMYGAWNIPSFMKNFNNGTIVKAGHSAVSKGITGGCLYRGRTVKSIPVKNVNNSWAYNISRINAAMSNYTPVAKSSRIITGMNGDYGVVVGADGFWDTALSYGKKAVDAAKTFAKSDAGKAIGKAALDVGVSRLKPTQKAQMQHIQEAAGVTPDVYTGNQNQPPAPPKDNTILYVAGGLGVVALLAVVMLKK